MKDVNDLLFNIFLLFVVSMTHFLSFLDSQWSETSPKRSQRWRSTLLNAPCQVERAEQGLQEGGMAGAEPCRRDRVRV